MLFTSVPVQAFAAEEPAPRIPVSAPLEQPEPVDYEAQQQAADESGGASASTPVLLFKKNEKSFQKE